MVTVTTRAPVRISLRMATEMVRAEVDAGLTVTEMKPMSGGMSSHVFEWTLSNAPWVLVAKLSAESEDSALRDEYATLGWYQQHTQLPVPRPYALVDEPLGGFRGTGILMERIFGRHLGRCRITPEGRKQVQMQLARHIASLHENTRTTYGSSLREGNVTRWLDRFAPEFDREYHGVRHLLSRGAQRIVGQLTRELDAWLPEFNRPTLIHGDLWSNNILVDDSNPNYPTVRAFIDGTASYSEVEYELAYLRCFETADETFFRHYTRVHKVRQGFNTRCQIYWLRTLMFHVRTFGQRFLEPCERLVADLEKQM